MPKALPRLLFACLFAWSPLACSAAPEPPATRSVASAVVGGALDASHTSVVAIVTSSTSASPEQCSGVLVAPRVVLTAGHCTLGRSPAELSVDLGASIRAPDRVILVAEVHTYARFANTLDDAREGRDLGALVLTEDSGITPSALGTLGTLGPGNARGDGTALLVGFGQTGATDRESNGARTSAAVAIDGACDRLLAFGDAQRAACHGDSGGALFASTASGPEVLVGIVSGRAAMDTTCDPPAVAVRIDAYRAWIDALVAGTADDACSSTCPGASVDCPLALSADAGDGDAATADAAPPAFAAPVEVSGGCSLVPNRPTSRTFVVVALLALALARRVRDLNRS